MFNLRITRTTIKTYLSAFATHEKRFLCFDFGFLFFRSAPLAFSSIIYNQKPFLCEWICAMRWRRFVDRWPIWYLCACTNHLNWPFVLLLPLSLTLTHSFCLSAWHSSINGRDSGGSSLQCKCRWQIVNGSWNVAQLKTVTWILNEMEERRTTDILCSWRIACSTADAAAAAAASKNLFFVFATIATAGWFPN